MRRPHWLLIVLVSVMSCQNAGPEVSRPPFIRTTERTYKLGERIAFVIINNSSATIHLQTCCLKVPYYLDRFEDGKWISHGGYGVPCLKMCPSSVLVVDADHSPIDSVVSVTDQGTYRLRIPFAIGGNASISGEAVSNVFSIQ